MNSLLLPLTLVACVASEQADFERLGERERAFVYINPSVQVAIADYDEPIFYNSNYYWRTDGAVWSSNSGWMRVDAAPR